MIAAGLVAALALSQAAAPPVLTYDDALRAALARSQDLKAVQARLAQARTIGWKVWSQQLPQISASGSYTHSSVAAIFPFPTSANLTTGDLNTMPFTIQPQDQLGAQIQATIPLIAPQLWFGIGAASAGERQAVESAESARRDILFGVAQLYYGAVGARYAVQVIQKQLAIAQDHEKDAKVRFDAGTAPKVALLRAEIDRAQAEQNLRAARAGYDSARTALDTALDRGDIDYDVEVPPEPPHPAPEAGLEAEALQNRPDVKAAEAGLRSARRTRESYWAEYLPSLGAFAHWNWANFPGFSGTESTWAVGLALNWNLFDGSLREAQIRESGAKVAEAEATRRSAELKAVEEVRRSRLDLETAQANRAKAQEQADLARENQKLVEVNYKAGAATYIEVSDANNQLLSAELEVIAEQVKEGLAGLALLKAAGRFDPR
jgi:outer membrane protein TolC